MWESVQTFLAEQQQVWNLACTKFWYVQKETQCLLYLFEFKFIISLWKGLWSFSKNIYFFILKYIES